MGIATCNNSRIRLVRVFKGENELAVQQKGEALGPHMKPEIEKGESGSAEVDEAAMQE